MSAGNNRQEGILFPSQIRANRDPVPFACSRVPEVPHQLSARISLHQYSMNRSVPCDSREREPRLSHHRRVAVH